MVIDTNIIIDHLRTRQKTTSVFASLLNKRRLYISAVTVFELYRGANTEERREDIKKILRGIEVLPFDAKAAEIASNIMTHLEQNGLSIGIADIFIGATALSHKHCSHGPEEAPLPAVRQILRRQARPDHSRQRFPPGPEEAQAGSSAASGRPASGCRPSPSCHSSSG